jgi:hypothetical protein
MLEEIEQAAHFIRPQNKEFYLDTVGVFSENEHFMENPLWLGISIALLISILGENTPQTSPADFAQNWIGWIEGILPRDFVGTALPHQPLGVALATLQQFYFTANPDFFIQG